MVEYQQALWFFSFGRVAGMLAASHPDRSVNEPVPPETREQSHSQRYNLKNSAPAENISLKS